MSCNLLLLFWSCFSLVLQSQGKDCVNIIVHQLKEGVLWVEKGTKYLAYDVVNSCANGDHGGADIYVHRSTDGHNKRLLCKVSATITADYCQCTQRRGDTSQMACNLTELLGLEQFKNYIITVYTKGNQTFQIRIDIRLHEGTTEIPVLNSSSHTILTTASTSDALASANPGIASIGSMQLVTTNSTTASANFFSFTFLPYGLWVVGGVVLIIIINVAVCVAIHKQRARGDRSMGMLTENDAAGDYDIVKDSETTSLKVPDLPWRPVVSLGSSASHAPATLSVDVLLKLLASSPSVSTPTTGTTTTTETIATTGTTETIAATGTTPAVHDSKQPTSKPARHSFHNSLNTLANGRGDLALTNDRIMVKMLEIAFARGLFNSEQGRYYENEQGSQGTDRSLGSSATCRFRTQCDRCAASYVELEPGSPGRFESRQEYRLDVDQDMSVGKHQSVSSPNTLRPPFDSGIGNSTYMSNQNYCSDCRLKSTTIDFYNDYEKVTRDLANRSFSKCDNCIKMSDGNTRCNLDNHVYLHAVASEKETADGSRVPSS